MFRTFYQLGLSINFCYYFTSNIPFFALSLLRSTVLVWSKGWFEVSLAKGLLHVSTFSGVCKSLVSCVASPSPSPSPSLSTGILCQVPDSLLAFWIDLNARFVRVFGFFLRSQLPWPSSFTFLPRIVNWSWFYQSPFFPVNWWFYRCLHLPNW